MKNLFITTLLAALMSLSFYGIVTSDQADASVHLGNKYHRTSINRDYNRDYRHRGHDYKFYRKNYPYQNRYYDDWYNYDGYYNNYGYSNNYTYVDQYGRTWYYDNGYWYYLDNGYYWYYDDPSYYDGGNATFRFRIRL